MRLLLLVFLFICLQQRADEINFERNFHYTCFHLYLKSGDIKTALKHHKALGRYTPRTYNYYNLAFQVALDNKLYDKAKFYLKKCIETGLTPTESRNYEINSFPEKYRNQINDLCNNFYTKYIYTLYRKRRKHDILKYVFVKSLFYKDQQARSIISSTDSIIDKNIQFIDSTNCDTLIKFIKKYGMIYEENVTSDANLSIIYLHLRRYKNKYLDSCIRDACWQGKLHPDCYTFSEDQEALYNNSTIYASINLRKKPVIIYDIETIDERRYRVGMVSLYEQSLIQQFDLPPNYILNESLVNRYKKVLKNLNLNDPYIKRR